LDPQARSVTEDDFVASSRLGSRAVPAEGFTRQGIGDSLAIVTRISSHILRVLSARKWPLDNKKVTMRKRTYPPENYVP
jgi:hypothetical protein